jgi:hypothetical protein
MSTTLTPIPFTTPIFDGTRLALGPATSGSTTHAYYPLTTGTRMNHGLIAGAAGSGRHNLAAVLVATARAAMPLATVYLDGFANSLTESNPAIAETSTLSLLGENAGETGLAALERVVRVRQDLLTTLRVSHFRAAELPGLLVVVDGIENVFTGRGPRWHDVAKYARYLGISILAVPRTLYVREFDSPLLRKQLWGNVIGLSPGGTNTLFPEQMGLNRAAPGHGRITDAAGDRTMFEGFHLGRNRTHVLSTYRDSPLDARTHEALFSAVAE